jgi:hypothetical protein
MPKTAQKRTQPRRKTRKYRKFGFFAKYNIYYIYISPYFGLIGGFMVKRITLSVVLCTGLAFSVVNFPYPQEITSNGIKVSTAGASDNLKSKFTSFMGKFYEEGNCNGTSCARIKFDTESQTVSEGIGYGMILMVYFSDASRSYQPEFDKLWVYYKRWPNMNGFMNWKINGFSNAVENNGATDAEFDVALALAMAYYQFGDEKYKTDASSLIDKIRRFEMETDGLHKPGDQWNSRRNPSYVSPAAFEIFRSFDQDAFWQTAITRNYTLLKNNQNYNNNKLPSDWCNDSGNPIGNFSYDASRAPWRWAWSYQWFAHADAKTLLENMLPYVNGLDPARTGYDNNSTFVGSLMSPLIYSSTYQTKLNSFWAQLMTYGTGEMYFSQMMKLITGLTATGNMPNLKALKENSAASSSSIVPSSSSARSSSSATTPIAVPQIVQNNALIAMQNAINLQVASNAIIQIFDLKGNAERTLRFAQGSYVVHIADLPKGLYIVKATFGNEKRILKMAVK